MAEPGADLLRDTRVYLSGPMDFVASRAAEKAHGWRSRVGDLLRARGAIVFDPWSKPDVRGLHEYGREGESTDQDRNLWSFADTEDGERARAYLAARYRTTMHIDLRMVDCCDFVICYCPTNIYSVGTPHEIILAREEHKPVLFVSPPVSFPALEHLRAHLAGREDRTGLDLLDRLEREAPLKPNPRGIPSLWYMPLVDGTNFFDGFGFEPYRDRFDWPEIAMDEQEATRHIQRPLLPYLDGLDRGLPQRWDAARGTRVSNDDWILFNLSHDSGPGADLASVALSPGSVLPSGAAPGSAAPTAANPDGGR